METSSIKEKEDLKSIGKNLIEDLEEDHMFKNDEDDDDDDDEEEDDDDDDDDEEEEQDEDLLSVESRLRFERHKLGNLLRRLSTERLTLRVNDVLIKGNSKTKYSLIESEIKALKNASTMQELLQVANIANARLQRFEIFDSVSITLDSGPPELPGTTNVIVEVVETKIPLIGDVGIFTKPEVPTSRLSVYFVILGFLVLGLILAVLWDWVLKSCY